MLGSRVDEQRPGQRIVAVFHRLGGGLHAIDGEDVQHIRVLGVVGVAEETDGVRAAEHTLHQHVVVLAQLHVGGAEDRLLVLVKHLFDKVVKGAAVGAGDEALDRLGRPVGVDVGPGFGGGQRSRPTLPW